MKRIESLQNPLVKKAIKLRLNKNFRQQEKLVLVSGLDTIQELMVKMKPHSLFCLPEKASYFHSFCTSSLYLCSLSILLKILGLPSCDGTIGLFPLPPPKLNSSRYLLFLDGLQDPGNVGTLIRSMRAFGWEQLLLHNTVDIFNDKCLRSAKGMSLQLPYSYMNYQELENYSQENKLPLYLAETKGSSPEQENFSDGCVLILGNEGRGSNFSGPCKKVAIPMEKTCESLNVGIAGSLLMYMIHPPRKI